MPRSLKLYLAGVVTIGALALIVATPLFPADAAIALPPPDDGQAPSGYQLLLGVAKLRDRLLDPVGDLLRGERIPGSWRQLGMAGAILGSATLDRVTDPGGGSPNRLLYSPLASSPAPPPAGPGPIGRRARTAPGPRSKRSRRRR